MTFDEVLTQVTDLLQREGRVSYRALKIRFNLDDGYIEGLKDELIAAKRLAADEDGKVLVWIGEGRNGETEKRGNGETAKQKGKRVRGEKGKRASCSSSGKILPRRSCASWR